jgi:hypothetical protein
MTDNALLYNAAISGMTAGSIKGRWLTAVNSGTPPAIGTADPSYAAIASQCTAFATEVDSLLPNDHAGSVNPAGTQAISVVGTGVAIVPSTGAIQMAQLGKARLLEALAHGAIEGRYYAQPTALTAAELASVATQIEDAYDVLAAVYVQPVTSPDTLNNQLIYYGAYNGAIAGMLAGCPDVSQVDNEGEFLNALSLIALTLAAAVDTGIAYDATITQAAENGLPAVPEPDATNIIQMAELAKYRLMHSIAFATMYQRNALSLVLSQFGNNAPALATWCTSVAAPLIALYKATVGNLITTLVASTINNPGLWNEAYAGFIAGNFAGRPITDTSDTDPNYEAVSNAAVAFATEVDAAVGAQDLAGGPVPTGTTAITVDSDEKPTVIIPTTGTIQEAELGKTGIMWAICRGVNHGRPLLGTTADTTDATYSAISQSVVALYLKLATVLNTP